MTQLFDALRRGADARVLLRSPALASVEAHRLAHKLRDPKFYTARTKRAVNSRGAL